MLISLVTPTHNSEGTILRNIESVLAQTHTETEHIIIDCKSIDNTLSIINDAYQNSGRPYRVISEDDEGIADAFNKGIRNASGSIVGILNSDDEYYDSRTLQRVCDSFKESSPDFIHGNIHFCDILHGSNTRRPLMCPLTTDMPYNHPTMFLKKSLYEKLGLFDMEFLYAMDFEWVCRMYSTASQCEYPSVYITETPLVKMYAGGVSWKNEYAATLELEKALKRHNFWNQKAFKNLFLRRCRIRLKILLTKLKLSFIIKMWRDYKWERNH